MEVGLSLPGSVFFWAVATSQEAASHQLQLWSAVESNHGREER